MILIYDLLATLLNDLKKYVVLLVSKKTGVFIDLSKVKTTSTNNLGIGFLFVFQSLRIEN